MKKYFVIDSCISKAGEEWSEMLDTASEAEAVAIAESMWNKMSHSDRKRRNDFYLGFGVEDPENKGYPDYDSLKIVWSAI